MQELWLRAHIERTGHLLTATVYTSKGMDAQVFTASVDLRPIAAFVRRLHRLEHQQNKISGCVGCDTTVGFWGIGKLVKKIGRTKLIRKVAKVASYTHPFTLQAKLLRTKRGRRAVKKVRRVIRSKHVGVALGAAALAFPPIGTPALAAYASANATLSAIENGNRAAAKIRRLARLKKRFGAFSRKAKKAGRRKTARYLKRRPKVRARLRLALAAKKRMRKLSRNKSYMKRMRALMKKRAKARKVLKAAAAATRRSKSLRQRSQARKASAVLVAVARNRARLRAIAQSKAHEARSGQTGILVTARGPVRGKYRKAARVSSSPDLLMLANRSEPGTFERIGGCIGCGLFSL